MISEAQFTGSRVANTHRKPLAAAVAPSTPVCPLCGAAENAIAFMDAGCELRACGKCDLFFVHPYPQAPRQHEHVATGRYEGIRLLDCKRRYQGERLYYARHFPLIAKEVRGSSSLLDVGCGTGHLLERFRDWPDLHRAGIELNSHAAEFARGTAACDIHEVPFEHFHSDRKFDAITLVNVFSHIPSFDGLFHALRNAMAPGGKVILRTTQMRPDVSRWAQLHWGIPDDLHFLGLRTLDYVCERYGFGVVRQIRIPYEQELFEPSRWQQVGRDGWVNAIKRVGVAIPGLLPGLQRIYASILGRKLFVSFIVLKPLPASEVI